MTEEDVVEMVEDPVTRGRIVADLRDLGVEAGETLLVHASLSSLGWVCGRAQAVVDALLETVTEDGTLVMPTHTPQYSDPAAWTSPPVPDHWVEQIPECMPAYRPDVTQSRGMGEIPECFRTYPDAVRSDHPIYSFAAWGADAEEIVADHRRSSGLGEHSPLASVYEQGGRVLLLGVDHEVNTSMHLAEYRADIDTGTWTERAAILEAGERTVVTFEDIETSTDDFDDLGAAFETEVGLTEGSVGTATAKLIDQRALVDFAVQWFEANR